MPGPAREHLDALTRQLEALDRKRAQIVETMEWLRGIVEREEADADLTAANQTGKNHIMANYEVAPAGKHSQSKRAPMSPQASRFLHDYAWPAGILSLRDLATRMRTAAEKRGGAKEDLHITHSHLSQALNADYPMSRERAERVRELTKSAAKPEGYEVSKRNWRGLRD